MTPSQVERSQCDDARPAACLNLHKDETSTILAIFVLNAREFSFRYLNRIRKIGEAMVLKRDLAYERAQYEPRDEREGDCT